MLDSLESVAFAFSFTSPTHKYFFEAIDIKISLHFLLA